MASRSTPVLTLIAALVGVIGLAAAVFFLLDAEPSFEQVGSRTVPAEDTRQPPIVSSEAPDLPLPTYVPEQRPTPEAASPPPTGSIRGRLVDENRLPISSGRVRAMIGRRSLFMASGTQLEPLDLDPVEISGNGDFRLSGLPARGDVILALDGGEFVRMEQGPYGIRPGEETVVGDLIVEKGYSVRGSVLTADGQEISGARVALIYGAPSATVIHGGASSDALLKPERVVTTLDDGRFQMDHTPRWQFSLAVSAEGFASRLVQGGSPLGGDLSELTFTVILQPALQLSGVVEAAEDGKPLMGITLMAINQTLAGQPSVTVSDRAGRFRFKDLADGDYRLQADGPGWARKTLRVPANALDKNLSIRLLEEGSLSGVVRTPEGEFVTRYDLNVLYGNSKAAVVSPTELGKRVRDNDGRFELTGLESGWYSIEVWAQGFALTSTDAIRVAPGQHVEGIDLTLQHGATIRGRVVDDLEQPIVGAKVSLHTNKLANVEFLRSREWKSAWQASTNTDSEGVFQLTEISERAYQVQVDHPDYPVFLVDDVWTESGQLADMQTIVVPRPGTIRGTAMDASGIALRRGTVSLGGPINRSVQVDGEGRFVFQRLLPGEYYLDARSNKKSASFSFGEEVQRGMALVPIQVRAGQEVSASVRAP